MAVALSRRTMLAGTAAGAVVFAAGGAFFLAGSDETALTRSVLARLIGPFTMADEDFGKLVAAVDRKPGYPGGAKLHLVSALERSGWSPQAMDRLPAGIRDDYETLQRAILTEFVVRTSYMHSEKPATDRLVYLGPQPCSSPFAVFT